MSQVLKSIAAAAAIALLPCLAQAQISDNVVKIGVLTDLSGPASDATGQGSVAAAQMAIDDLGGKAGDRTITIISADHQNKADIASNTARKWIDEDNVETVPFCKAARLRAAGEAVDWETGDRIDAVGEIGPVLDASEAVLGAEQQREAHGGVGAQQVHVAPAVAIYARLIGEEGDALPRHEVRRVGKQDLDPRPHLRRRGGGRGGADRQHPGHENP